MDIVTLHEQLIELSNRFGSQVEYARAGGGNASVKHDGVLHIKPSGTTLASLRDEELVPLRIDVLLDALTSDPPEEGDPVMAAAAAARLGDPDGRRPSVEILFHALMPEALVLHLHPLVANAVTCNEQGRALTEQLLGRAALWVDYIDPGVPLARGIADARRAHERRTDEPAPAITMLGNHGIIVAGDSYDEVAGRIHWLTDTVRAAIGAATPAEPPPDPLAVDPEGSAEAFRRATGRRAAASDSSELVRALAVPSSGPVSRGPLIPDQIVYAGSFPAVLPANPSETPLAVADFEAAHGRTPVVAVVPGQAVLAVGDTPKAARNALDTFVDALRVARDADRLGAVRVMDERERRFIETWEAEAYRRSVAAES